MQDDISAFCILLNVHFLDFFISVRRSVWQQVTVSIWQIYTRQSQLDLTLQHDVTQQWSFTEIVRCPPPEGEPGAGAGLGG